MIRSLLGIRRPIIFSRQKFTQDFDTRLMHYRPSFGRNPDQYGHIELIIGKHFFKFLSATNKGSSGVWGVKIKIKS